MKNQAELWMLQGKPPTRITRHDCLLLPFVTYIPLRKGSFNKAPKLVDNQDNKSGMHCDGVAFTRFAGFSFCAFLIILLRDR